MADDPRKTAEAKAALRYGREWPEFMRSDMQAAFIAGWRAAMRRVDYLDKVIATGEQG